MEYEKNTIMLDVSVVEKSNKSLKNTNYITIRTGNTD